MATRSFTGGGVDRKQQNTLTPTVISAGSGSFTVTINNNTAVFLSTSADVLATVCAGIVSAVNAQDAPEFREVVATTDSTLVYITARTAGLPFTQTSGATGTSAALSTSTTTANKSRSDWGDTLNWAGGVVPVATDDVLIENTDVPILYGLDQSAVALTSVTIRDTFTGNIGLPIINEAGYIEYRTSILAFSGITTLTIFHGAGDPASRFRITVGANNCAVTLNGPIDSSPSSAGVLEWEGGAGTHTFTLNNGSAFITLYSKDAVTISSITAVQSAIETGPNCTVTTATITGGSTVFRKSPTTLTMVGGANVDVLSGAGSSTTITNRESTIVWQGNAITNYVGNSGSTIDFSEDRTAITVTNAHVSGSGWNWNDPDGRVTVTNGVAMTDCGPTDGSFQTGKNRTLIPAAYY
jgi:hypothetical protein